MRSCAYFLQEYCLLRRKTFTKHIVMEHSVTDEGIHSFYVFKRLSSFKTFRNSSFFIFFTCSPVMFRDDKLLCRRYFLPYIPPLGAYAQNVVPSSQVENIPVVDSFRLVHSPNSQ